MVSLFGFLIGEKLLPVIQKGFFAALSFIGILSLWATQSRAGWISFMGAFLFSTLLVKRGLLFFLAIVTLCLGVLFISPSDILIHKDADGKEQSVSERFTLWNRALEMIKAHPLTGTGLNTYSVESDRYMKDDKKNLSRYYAHNSYLQMGAEAGLIALFFYLLFIGTFLFLGFKRSKEGIQGTASNLILKGALTGVVGFFIFSFFESQLFSVQPSQLFYFFLAMGTVLISEKQRTA
jgi:O-antigen ligase